VLTRAQARDLVIAAAAALLERDPATIDPADRFNELGLDSADIVELRNRVNALTGMRLPTTLLFDFPTPRHLADALYERLTGNRGHTSPAVVPAVPAAASPGTGPIAIIGMACRYPGSVATPEDLWRLLADGTDATSALPTNRGWDLDELLGDGAGRPGTCSTSGGGFLHDADAFDAAFFGISPREALAMDPQQRLLLETCWEAIERADLDPAGLAGSPVGVFAGVIASDYGPRLYEPTGTVGGHLLTGTTASVASGRVAYTLGLTGPAITIDTACSSSLVAIQLAVQSLRNGGCSLALAGGVTVMANPGHLVEFSRQNGLAPDGRVKTFSAAADGTAFAEGAGMLLLERLSAAQQHGHPVLAIIRGAAVNSDGASNGLSAPNGQAQRQVIRQALADAGLDTTDIDAVEAHGTGTALGDPIEAQTILATYGQGRPSGRPVWLGSVKSNIGHTQAAGGVAGVIKMVLAMRHGLLPATLHADPANDRVDWDSGRVWLLTAAQPWPAGGRPRRAAVSSAGISGTNAHLLLEEASPVAAPPSPAPAVMSPVPADGALTWVLSAQSATALRAQGQQFGQYAGIASDADLAAAGPCLARRSSFAHRAVVTAASRGELCAALAALAAGEPHPALHTGVASREAAPVFVFPGQGAQWAGMATELLAASKTFASQLRRCADALQPHTGWSVLDVLTGADGAPGLDQTEVVQPVLFAVAVALAQLWRSAGVEPAAVVGHSQGEIAAAHIAGALTLAQAAKISAVRGQVIGRLDGTGGVLAIGLPAEQARQRIARWPDRLWVAADNGPAGTVVAGDLDAIDELAALLGDKVEARRTPVAYAAHTPHVAAVKDELLARIGDLAPVSTDIAICSSLAGDYVPGTELTAGYWYRNLASPVRFDAAVRAAGSAHTRSGRSGPGTRCPGPPAR
jgi:acyl transferase domain-containing protein/acyl carrier protein